MKLDPRQCSTIFFRLCLRFSGLLVFIFQASISLSQSYPSQKIQLLSLWNDSSIVAEPYFNLKYSGVWGYYDSIQNKSYGIIGSVEGTHIIEVTDPTQPIERAFIPGRRDSCRWRELKTYRNYLYMVSDDPEPNHFQIADLSFLPDSVRIVHDSDSIFSRAHAIYIDGNKLYCSSVKGGEIGFAKLAVFDLTTPERPVLLRNMDADSVPFSVVHDMFVRNDTAYVSAGYAGLFVYKFNGEIFEPLGSISNYTEAGFNHSSYLTKDGKTLIMADESPAGLPLKNVDVSDLSDMKLRYVFESKDSATPHNPYMKYGLAFISYYKDGIRVYNVSNPALATEVGFFDSYPNPTFAGNPYAGNWGIYTDLPGDIIIAGDMQSGMFTLDVSALKNLSALPEEKSRSFSVEYTNRGIVFHFPSSGRMKLLDTSGRLIDEQQVQMGSKSLRYGIYQPGIYILQYLSSNSLVQTQKIRIIH